MDSYQKLFIFISIFTIGFIPKVKACGGDIYEEQGIIRSPGFTNRDYPNNIRCIWNIYASNMGQVFFNITYFELEVCGSCNCDHLQIWDGVNDTSPLIGKFCGNEISKLIQSTNNALRIEFKTDPRKSKGGFEIHFTSTSKGNYLNPDAIRYVSEVTKAKNKLSEWFIKQRKSNIRTSNRWGLQAHRIACALYLNDEQLSQSHPDGKFEDELRYEIEIQVLDKISKTNKFSAQEIATFLNSMLVTCLNPRDFHGYDLVAELRRRVEEEIHTNPFEILALCNANDTMTIKDIDRLESAYSNGRNRPLWFDTQAFAILALNCIMRKNETLDNATLTLRDSMIQELIEKQATNGIVGSLQDTALVLQALIAANSSEENFNFEAAIKFLLSMQQDDGSFGSFLNSYYILPVFNSKSLIDISSVHCQEPKNNEIEALNQLKRRRGKMFRTLLSVLIGSDMDLGKTWTLKVPENSSFYDAFEIISSLDSKFKVEYSISEGKPYVSAVSGVEEDPELGFYWFTYVKINNSSMNANFVKKSPADVIIEENQELILWYKEEN